MEKHYTSQEENKIALLNKKLEESELILKSLIDQSPLGICILDAGSLKAEMVNDSFLKIAGKPRKVFEEQTYWTIFKEVAHLYEPVLRDVIDTGIAFHTQDTAVTLIRNGVHESLYVSFVYEPVKDSGGNVIKVMVFVLDTTTKVLSQKRIEKSEQNLRNTILQAPVAMAILRGPEHIVEIANKRMYELWGKQVKDMDQKPMFEGLPEARNQGFEALLSEVYHTGKSFSAFGVPVNLPRNSGIETVFINMLYEPYREERGEVSGIVVVANDVTELIKSKQKVEESEAKYRSLFETMDQGFCIIDIIFNAENEPVDYRFLETNPMFENQSGLKDVVGKTALEILPTLEKHWIETYGKVALSGQSIRFSDGSEVMDKWFDVFAFKIGGNESRKIALLFTNITERYRANADRMRYLKQIEDGKNQLQFAIEAAELATWDFNLIENKFITNDRYSEWFGYRAETYADNYMALQIIAAEDRERVFEAYRKALTYSSGGRYDIEFTIRPDKQPERVLRAKGKAWFNEEKIAYRFNGTLQDVTEQVKARNSLQESEERFRIMADVTPNFIYILNPDGTQNYLNKYGLEYLDLKPEEVNGLDWRPFVHPEDMEPTSKLLIESIKNRKEYSQEHRLLRKDGVYRWFLSKSAPSYYPNGELYGYVGSGIDITDLKDANEQLKAINIELDFLNISLHKSKEEFLFLSEFIPHMVWRTQPNGDHDYYNSRWYSYTGLSYEDTKDQGWMVPLHPDDRDRTETAWNRSLATGDPYVIEYRFRKFDGSYRWFLGRALSHRDDKGNIIRWYGTLTDIHDQKIASEMLAKADKELIKKNDELLKVNADLDNFIYTASHDLKAPISNIEGLVATLLKQLPEEVLERPLMKKIMSMIMSSIDRFKKTILNLTEITKLQKGFEENASQIDVAKLLMDVQLDLQQQIQETSTVIETKLSCPPINFSSKNLRSIFYNLISNAIKYRSMQRNPVIHISSRQEEGFCLITIKDNGLGIPEVQQEKIFQMFKRAHSHVDGSGVGLYIVKKIVENAGGRIELKSEVDKGSTFTIFLKNT